MYIYRERERERERERCIRAMLSFEYNYSGALVGNYVMMLLKKPTQLYDTAKNIRMELYQIHLQ